VDDSPLLQLGCLLNELELLAVGYGTMESKKREMANHSGFVINV
jgi:hypothetical protein